MANLIDSSVWVAMFLNFDTQHEKAVKLFSGLKGKIHLPYCVISEVATILTYKHSKEQSDNFISYIQNLKGVEFVENELTQELEFYSRLKDRVSFTDATIILLAREMKLKIVTFDKQLKKVAKKVCSRS